MTEKLVERCREELNRQMEAQADDTTPSSIQRAKGLVWLDGWFDLTAIIPIVRADALEEVSRHLSAVQYDPAPYTAMKYRLASLAKG